MKKNLLILMLAIAVASCTSFRQAITVDAPLSDTLNEVKSELAAFKYALNEDALLDTDTDKKYLFTCGEASVDAIHAMEIKDVVVTVSIANVAKGEGGGGIAVKTVSFDAGASRESTASNSLVLKVTPQEIPTDNAQAYEDMTEEGIADSLLAVVEQFAQTNDQEPCLRGAESTLTLGFKVVDSQTVGGGFDIVVLNLGAKQTKSDTVSNTLAVKFDFNGAETE